MLEIVLYAVPSIWLVWALLIWFSPYVYMHGAQRVTVNSWLLPAWFILKCRDYDIDVYVAAELPVGDQQGYAFSSHLGLRRVIFLNEAFIRCAVPSARDFVLAHELGHHHYGHPMLRVGCRALFLDLIPWVRQKLDLTEHVANVFAEEMTGHPPSVVWGPTVVTAAVRPRGIPTEESES